MDKLKLLPLHLTDFPLRNHPDGVGMKALLPGVEQTAIAFGWSSPSILTGLPTKYWICELGPGGASLHWLPDSLNQRYAELVGWSAGTADCNKFMLAFRCGQSIGLLLGTLEVQLYDPQSGSLQAIPIEGPGPEAAYVPLCIGRGHAQQYPVVLASPGGGYFDGKHLALLRVDPSAGKARWDLSCDRPQSLDETDYAPLMAGTFQLGFGMGRWTPLIYSAAWRGSDWLFYVGPKHTAHHRTGMPPSALGQHGLDLRLQQVIHQAGEDSFGDLSSCGEWLILTPHKKSGPRKGRQTLVNLSDGRLLEPVPPRGHAGWRVVDHDHGCWWLLPLGMDYSPDQVLACAAA